MSNWNLPPGCTGRDIDHAAGDYNADCESCEETFSACDLNADGLCETCVEEKKREEEQP